MGGGQRFAVLSVDGAVIVDAVEFKTGKFVEIENSGFVRFGIVHTVVGHHVLVVGREAAGYTERTGTVEAFQIRVGLYIVQAVLRTGPNGATTVVFLRVVGPATQHLAVRGDAVDGSRVVLHNVELAVHPNHRHVGTAITTDAADGGAVRTDTAGISIHTDAVAGGGLDDAQCFPATILPFSVGFHRGVVGSSFVGCETSHHRTIIADIQRDGNVAGRGKLGHFARNKVPNKAAIVSIVDVTASPSAIGRDGDHLILHCHFGGSEYHITVLCVGKGSTQGD